MRPGSIMPPFTPEARSPEGERFVLRLMNNSSASPCLFPPVLARKTVLAGTFSGHLSAFHAGDGRVAWKTRLPAFVGNVCVENGRVFVMTGDARVRALRLRDGTPLWTRKVDVFGYITVRQGVVYCGTARTVYALRAIDGFSIWEWDNWRFAKKWGTRTSRPYSRPYVPLVTDGLVFIPCASGHLIARDSRTGRAVRDRRGILCAFGGRKMGFRTYPAWPAVGDVNAYGVVGRTLVVDGPSLATFRLPSFHPSWSTVSHARKLLYSLAVSGLEDVLLYTFETRNQVTGRRLLENLGKDQAKKMPLGMAGPYLYTIAGRYGIGFTYEEIAHQEKTFGYGYVILCAVDLRTGRTAWRIRVGACHQGPGTADDWVCFRPIASRGNLYFVSENGYLCCYGR